MNIRFGFVFGLLFPRVQFVRYLQSERPVSLSTSVHVLRRLPHSLRLPLAGRMGPTDRPDYSRLV